MITHEIRNLRSVDWRQAISKQDLREMMLESDEAWQVTPWQHHRCYASPMRSFLVTSDGGAIYAVWVKKAQTHA